MKTESSELETTWAQVLNNGNYGIFRAKLPHGKPYRLSDKIGVAEMLEFVDFEQADLAAKRAANGEFPQCGEYKTGYFRNR
jgi:hypothetical protein